MNEIVVLPVGQSLGVELPREVLERFNLKSGDTLVISEGNDGTLRISRAEPGHSEQLRLAREGMREYSDALRELAK